MNNQQASARVCVKCGKALTQSRPSATKYCDANCRRAAERDRRGVGQQVIMRPCGWCGATFDAHPPTGGPLMRYCTADCRVLADRKRRARRKAELRKQASTPKRTCPDCGTPLTVAQMRRCTECAGERTRELRRKREREYRKLGKRPAPRRTKLLVTAEKVDTYDPRKYNRAKRTTKTDIDSWITAIGSRQLPADPVEALKVVLAEHEDFREAFADVHGI